MTEKERQEKEQQVNELLGKGQIREAEEIINDMAKQNAPVTVDTYRKLIHALKDQPDINFGKEVEKYINQMSQLRVSPDNELLSIHIY